MIRRPPRSTLFPYTTLFRSKACKPAVKDSAVPQYSGEGFLVPCAGQIGQALRQFRHYRGNQSEWKNNRQDRKSTRLNSSHANISYAVFCLQKTNLTFSSSSF